MFANDGGLPISDQISGFEFLTLAEAQPLLVDRLARRVAGAVAAREQGTVLLLNHGQPTTP